MRRVTVCACACIGLIWAGGAYGSMLASDHQGSGAYASWGPGTNGGTGWGGAWTFRDGGNVLLTSTNSNRGWFVANSTNNNGSSGDTNSDGDINSPNTNQAWGLYANSGNQIYAVRPFDGALGVGQTFKFDIDNGSIATGGVVGLRLLSDASNIASREFEFRFIGGESNYVVFGGETQTTGIPYTREGLHLEFTLTGSNAWSLSIRRLVDGLTETRTGTLVNGNPIVGLALRNQYAGSGSSNNAYLNNIAIVPEPAAMSLLGISLLLIPGRRRLR